jgi:ketosteroid isomerase-like protein
MTTGISRDLVQEYFRACVSRDPERIAKFLHDDVEWSLSGPVDLLPFCGQRSGKQAVVDTLVRLVPAVIRLTAMNLEQVLIDGDRAASYMHLSGVHAHTGRTVSYRSAQFLRFRDGKIVEFRGVIDSFDAAEQVLGHAINTALMDDPTNLVSSGNTIAL